MRASDNRRKTTPGAGPSAALTLGAQLQTWAFALTRVNDELENLLGSTGVPTVLLDADLRIRRFTTAASLALGASARDFCAGPSRVSMRA